MKKLRVNICASPDSFGAYAADYAGLYGAGDTIADCQKDLLRAIEDTRRELPPDQWPAILKEDYEVEWHYDVQSLLLHYGSLLSLSALERITGIHQKQLWAYMHGRSHPRRPQAEKIEKALRGFGLELSQVCVQA